MRLGLITLFVYLLSFSDQTLAESEKFKVGVTVPLTGPAADYGESIKNCIELARRDFPDKFTDIQFIYEDNLFDPKEAVANINKFTSLDKVDLGFAFGASICRAVVPLAEQLKLPFIGLCAARGIFSDKSYAIRFKKPSDDYTRLQMEYLHKHGLNKIGLILSEHTYLEEILGGLELNLKSDQSLKILDRRSISDSDFRSLISKLKKQDYDAIGILLGPGQISQFYLQAKEQNFSTPTFGTDFFESISEIKASKNSMDGAVFVNTKIKDSFEERYVREFNKNSQLAFGAAAYEFALLIGKTFNASSKLSNDSVVSKLRESKPHKSLATEDYTFVPTHKSGSHFAFPITLKRIQGKQFKVVP